MKPNSNPLDEKKAFNATKYFFLKSKFRKPIYAILAISVFFFMSGVEESLGQTPYVMSAGNYSEDFINIASATNWPNNFNGPDCAEWTSVAVNATGTVGDGVKISSATATFASGSGGGVQRGSANVQLLSTSTANSCAIDLLLNFTGRNAGTISFDVATVFNSTGNRDSKLKLFYSIDGTTFTELTGTNLPFTARNNVALSAGISAIALPSVFNNSATARLRFYEFSTTLGGSPLAGSQPKISIDNISVTSTSATTTPTLAAASATVDANFSITYTDDAVWRSAVTSVSYGATTLTTGTDYSFAAGILTLKPTGGNAALHVAGTQTVTVVATGYTNATVSQPIGAGADAQLVMNIQPTAPATNGGPLVVQPSVFIRDQYGNATTSTSTVTANIGSGTWTPTGSTTATAVSGTATFSGLTATSAAAVTGATIDFTSGSLTNIVSSTFNIPAPAGLTPPTLTAASATVDADFNITYTDDAAWRAAVTTVSYGASVLTVGTDYLLSAGILTLKPTGGNAALHLAGTQTVTVSATGYGDVTVSQPIGAGADYKLAMNVQPTAPSLNGGALAVQPSIFIQDQYGNATASTATITANTGSGVWTPGGSTTAFGISGTATFSGLTATSLSSVTGATIDFTSPGLVNVVSGLFNIPAPAADHIVFVNTPINGVSNSYLNSFTVEARRADNTLDNTFAGSIVISLASGSGTLTGTLTKTAFAGVATFNDIKLSAADTYTLYATSGVFSQITSGTITVIDPLAKWTFDACSLATPGATAVFTVGSAVAEEGVQTGGSAFSSLHASSATAWAIPTGNGSVRCASSDHWALNDYYQFQVSTLNYKSIGVSFEQTGSNTGPNNFTLSYSIDGSTFTTVTSYAITNDGWSATAPKSASKHSLDLSTIPALNGVAAVYFRLVCNSTSAISGTFGTGGTNRVDNFTVTGTPCTPPSAFALTGGGSYCSGGSGVAVGLAGSEIGVDYQLVLNGSTNVGSAVAGTGSSFSFGNQIAGTYTVIATNNSTSCAIGMTGNAIVVGITATVHNTTTGLNYCTIQSAIDAVTTVNGNIITVDAGTYAEHVIVNKELDLRGPNYGISGTGSRVGEAMIVPEANLMPGDPWTEVVFINSNNVSFDGFTVSGDNTSISGYSYAGMDLEKGQCVYSEGNSVHFSNNIVEKAYTMGFFAGGGYTTPHYTDLILTNNKFENIHDIDQLGYGFAMYIQATTGQISNNTVLNSRTGIQIQPYTVLQNVIAPVVSGNTFNVWREGVYYNYAENNASAWTISGNTINAIAPPVTPVGPVRWVGIAAETIYSTSNGGIITGNTINGNAISNPSNWWTSIGLHYTGNASTSTALSFSNNNVSGVEYGMVHDAPANISITGNSLTGSIKAISVQRAYSSAGVVQATGGTGNINATGGNTINGVATIGATLAELFTIEDAINHKVDESFRGLVSVKSNELFVTVNSFAGANTSASIQRGVDAASSGFTVNVNSGIYSGNINANKSLIILGDAGNALPGPGANVAIIDGGSLPGDAFLIANGVSNLTIKGFEMRNFTSNTYGIGNGISAWEASTSNINIEDNYFHNLGYNGVLVGNDGALGDHTNWLIKNNILETFEAYGFELTNASNSSIENNIIHSDLVSNPGTCIMVDARKNESGITIRNNEIDGAFGTSIAPIFIFADDFETPGANLNNVLIENNLISVTTSGTAKHIRIYNYAGAGTVTGVTVLNNSLSSLRTNTPAFVTATCNWWGTSVAGTIAGNILGNITYSPWITTGGDGAGTGFQPTGLCSYPSITLSETHVNVNCSGASTGSIDLTVADGTSPFTYLWSNSSTSQDLTGLAAGSYSVTVTDANSMTATTTITITEPTAVTASATSTPVSCTGGDGTATVTASGGTGAYTYLWSNSQTTVTATGLSTGTVTVTVTDANGCSASTSATVTTSLAGPVHNTTTGLNYCTIQAAIDASATLSGHTITVDAGIYAENIVVSKSLSILGPNAGVNACSGTRAAEAVVVPAISGISYLEIFHVAASNVTISGFTIDGDNTSITSGFTSTNGADIDAAEGVTVYETGVNNLTVSDNIIRNLSYFGVTLYDYPAGVPSSGHVIVDNKIQDLGTYDATSGVDYWGGAVLLYNNQYAAITNNCMDNVRLGVQTGNFYQANPGTSASQQISGNTMTGVRRTGVFHNLHYSSASALTISNNTITGASNANETKWDGIAFSSLSVPSTGSSNTINASAVTQASSGYEVWNVKSTTPSAISGGSVTGTSTGVFVNNYDGYSSNAGDGAHASITGLTINPTSGGTGVRVYDNPLSSHSNVQASFGAGVTINASTNGLVIENTSATVPVLGTVAFVGQTGSYIKLINNANNLMATSATFDGNTGGSATLAQNFAIEDKIVHKIDASSLGYVSVNANNDYVTVNSFVTPITTSAKVQRGVDAAVAGYTVNVAAGTYVEDVTVNKQLSVLGAGEGSSIVSGAIGGSASTFQVTAANVLIDGFTITREGNNTTDWNNSGLNTAGVAIQSQGITAEVRYCEITGMRTGIDINNSNGNNIHNNNIHFNRTGMIFRNQTDNTSVMNNFITDNWTAGVLFLDASSGTNSPVQSAANSNFNSNDISGNWYGQIVDRQSGGSLLTPGTNLKNFTCNWYGVIPPAVSTANSSEPGYAAQIPVAYGGSSVAPGGMPDILGAASANFTYTPYLTAGTDIGGVTTDGFQPGASCSVPCALIASASSTDATCPSNTNGAASVAVSGGTGSYTYLWSNGAITSSLTGLIAGTYTVTINDVNGCTTSTSVTITTSLAGPVHNTTTGLNYCTIQSAIDAVTTVNGNIITVDAGTYAEHVIVNKELDLRGPNYGISGTGSRVGEAMIVPEANLMPGDPWTEVVFINSNNVSFDGFTVSGDNTSISGYSYAGMDLEKGQCVYSEGNSVHFSNNIVEKAYTMGFFAGGGYTTPHYTDLILTNNKFENIHDIDQLGYGFAMYIQATTGQISNNTVLNSRTGIQIQPYTVLQNVIAPVVSGNTFNVWREGVYYNYAENNASAWTISGNTINAIAPPVTPVGPVRWVGIAAETIYSTSNGGIITGNTINGNAISNPSNWWTSIGLHYTGNASTSTALSFSNNSVSGVEYGMVHDAPANISITGNSLTGSIKAISVQRAYSSAGVVQATGGTGNINATGGNTINGVATIGASLAQLFTIEDAINHKVDESFRGLVSVKSNELFVTVNSFAGANTSASIQRGVDAASSGFTVNVGSGTFADNVTVNKQVTIAGQGQGITTVYPASSNPNCGGAGGGSLCAGGSNIFLVQSNNVIIHDLTADGDNTSLTSGTVAGGADLDARNGIITDHASGVYQNLEVYNVEVKNVYLRGMYASSGGSFNFHNNTVSNVQANAASIGLFNFGGAGSMTNNTVTDCNDAIASNWSTGTTFSGNVVSSSGSGIHTDNNGGSGGVADIISNNTVQNSDLYGYGIWVFAPYRNVQVLNNTVSNVDVGLMSAGQNAVVTPVFSGNTVDGQNKPNSTGVYMTTSLFGYGSTNATVDFNNNFVKNNAADGFYLESEAGYTLAFNAHDNSITGNAPFAVENSAATGTYNVNMTCNWWGSSDVSVIASEISGTATYLPWTVGGTDGDLVTSGFQPSASCSGAPCSVSNDFSSAVTLSSTQAAGTWYTDRFAPAGFAAGVMFGGDARLQHSISAADCETCRGGFNGAFYNTQGRKYDLPAGTVSTQIDLYIPSSWASTGKRMAGFWGTAFDASNGVSGYPILEFTSDGANPRFRAYETGTGAWIDMGLPVGFTYDSWVSLRMDVLPSGEFRYSANDLRVETTTGAPDGSVRLGNTILQGHNSLAGVSYDIYWDNYQYSPLYSNVAVTGSLNCNVSSVSVNVSAVGGYAPYTGEGTFSAGAGSHTYTVTDTYGCSASTTITVTAPATLAASSSATAIACTGGSSTVTITATGGTAPYSGTGTFTATAGTYTYAVSDVNLCTASTTITITEPTAVTASATSTPVSCTGGDGTATVTASGGTGAYTYLWSNSQTTVTATGLSTGTVTVTVTDANGCSASTSATVTTSLAGPVHNTTTGLNYCTIQSAIDAVTTVNGNIITVDAGTYAEHVIVNKELDLRGPNYGISGTGSRVGEAMIVPEANLMPGDPWTEVVFINSNNVSFDGFKVSGDNTSISGYSYAGMDLEKGQCVYSEGNSVHFSNNIVEKAYTMGFFAGGGYTTPHYTDLILTNNKFENIHDIDQLGYGFAMYIQATTGQISNNTVLNSRTGIQIQPYTVLQNVIAPVVSGNTFNVWREGVYYNYAENNASAWTISGNTINAIAPPVTPVGPVRWVGIAAETIYSTSNGGIITGNTINGNAISNPSNWWTSIGLHYTGNASTSTALSFSNNNVSGVEYGMVHDAPANISITGNSLTGSIKAISVQRAYSSAGVVQATGGTGNINATGGNTINGVATIGASLAQLFTIEDAINHKVDESFRGLVSVKSNELFVTVNSFAGANTSASIQRGVDASSNGFTVNVGSGTFNEDVTVNKQVTVLGSGIGSSIVSGPIGGGGSTFQVTSSNVVIDGFTITRAGNNTTDWNLALNTAGVAIQSQGITAEVRYCEITGMRTGIDINNSNGNNIHNNNIHFNRTGMIFRNQTDNTSVMNNFITDNWTAGVLFLDASSGTNSPVQSAANSNFNSNDISGNWYGQIVDRQSGGSLLTPGTNLKNFTCNWYGVIPPIVSTANSSEPGYAAQIPVAYGGSALAPGGQPDILGAASANFVYAPYQIVGTDVGGNPNDGFQPVAGCSASCALVASSSATTISCNGGTATVTVTASGGTGTYIGTGTFTVTAGTYSYPVSDVNGCSTSTTITVTEPSVLVASSSATAIACNGGNATVTVTASGGTAPYSGTGPFTVGAGTYTYTVTDFNGCSTTTTITITAPSALVASSSATAIACNGGNSTVTVTASGGTAPYSGTGPFTVGAGTYTYTVTDFNGCSTTTTITVTAPSALVASSSATAIACNGGNATVTVTASGGTAPYSGTGPFTVGAGTYTYTVTDSHGCSTSTTITITAPSALVASSSSTTIACLGGKSTVTVTASGGTAPYSGTGSFTVGAGTYTYTVTDSHGCSTTTTITITAPSALIASSSATAIACYGGNATVTVTASGGTAPYSGTGSFTVAAGTYTYTIADSHGCSASTTIIVTAPSILVASSSATVIACNGGTATVTVSASGGSAPYSGTGLFTVGAGTYTYTVTDSHGCSKNTTITVTAPSVLVASSSATAIACNGGTATVTVTASGGTAPYSGTGSFTVTAGTYTYTVTDSHGCSKNTTITVTAPSALVASSSATAIACNGGNSTVTVTASGGTAPYSGTGPFTVGAGTYTYTVTDSHGCSASTTITVTAPSALVASSSATAIACNGGNATVTVTASGGTAPYSGTGPFTVTAGTYSYTVTDFNGCSSTTTITVTAPEVLVASSSATAIACNGGNATVTVTASGGTAPYSGTGPFTVGAGTYTYTITDFNGCSTTTTITITEPTALSASSSATAIACNGGTATVTVTASGGTAPYSGTGPFTVGAGTYTYTVTDFNGCSTTTTITVAAPSALVASSSATAIACNGGNSIITVTASGGTAPYSGTGPFTVGAGTYIYTVTDFNGCSTTTTITITEPTALSASSSATAIACNGGNATVTVTASGGTAPYTGTGPFTVGAGTYTYTVTDFNGCSSTTTITVTAPEVLVASSSATAIACNGGNATVTVTASGGTAPYTGTGPFTVTAGTYTYTVTDFNGCSTTTTITVTQPATSIVASSTATTILCNGGTSVVTVSATGGTGAYTGTGTFPVTAGTHTYTVSDANGCSSSTTIILTQPSAIVATAVQSTAILCHGGSTTVTISATGGTGSYTGTGIFPVTAGTYSYTVFDANGCSATTSILVSQPLSIIASASQGAAILCHGGTTTVTITATGGTGTYSGTGTFTVSAGTHSYTVSDANGCSTTTSIFVTEPATSVLASSSATAIACNGGNSTVTVSATGGTGSYTGIGTFTVTAGTHTYTVTDGNGCSSVTTIIVTQPSAVIATSTATAILCNGGTSTVTVSASGGTAPYSGTGPFTVGAGTYTYTVTDFNGCSTTTTITVAAPSALVASSSATAILCNGGTSTVTVTASGGTAPYSGTGPFTVGAGTYTYTVTDFNGCSTTTTITITSSSALVASSSATAILCYSGSSTVTVSAAGGVSPYVGTGTFTVTAGTYSYTVSDANSCSSSTLITISQPAKVEGTITSVPPSCAGNDGTATVSATGGTGSYSYLWSAGSQTTQTATGLSAGFYSVTITDANGCTGSVSVTVVPGGVLPDAPGAISGAGGACRNQTNVVYSVVAVSGVTYSWLLPPGASGSSTTNSITLSFGPTYSGGFICVSAVNACGTSVQSCMNIPVLTTRPLQPAPVVGPAIICGGISGTTATYSTTSGNALSYNWTVTGTGVYIINGNGTNTILVNIPAGFGQGSVQVYGSNCVGNSLTRGMTITGIPTHSNAVVGPSFVCANSTATYTMPLVNGATTYAWTTTGDVALVVSSVNSLNTSATFNFGPTWTSGTITITVSNFCGSYSRTFTVRSVPDQPGSISGPGTALCGLTNVTYSIAAVAGATSYTWTVPVGVNIVSTSGSSIVVDFTGAFTSTGNICVAANNSCGSGIQRCFALTSRPGIPVITGATSVCKSQTSVPYSVSAVSGASSYIWSVIGGAVATPSGLLTANVNYTGSLTSSAVVRANAVNTCGASQPSGLNVNVSLFCRTAAEDNASNFTTEIGAYPNPTTGKALVSFTSISNSKVTIKVTDLLGNVIISEVVNAVEGDNSLEINLSDFAKGIYLLNVKAEEEVSQTLRLVVE